MDKITIITVSYNAVSTIERTILSVVTQTYLNIEYIIVDGGSTDGTVDIIKKYESQITNWVSEPDRGCLLYTSRYGQGPLFPGEARRGP